MSAVHVKFSLSPEHRLAGGTSSSTIPRNHHQAQQEEDTSLDSSNSSTTATTISRELRPLKGGLLGRRLSWMTVSTGNLSDHLLNITKEDPYIASKFKLLLKPPEFDRDDLLCSAHSFLSSIVEFIPSVKLDPTFEILKSIRSLVKSTGCIRLFGLLVHYQYWNVIYPAVKNAITQVKLEYEQEREAKRQEELTRLQKEYLDKESYGMRSATVQRQLSAISVPDIPHNKNNIFLNLEFNPFEDIENRMKLPQAIAEIDQRESGGTPLVGRNIPGASCNEEVLGTSECSSIDGDSNQDGLDENHFVAPLMQMSPSFSKRSIASSASSPAPSSTLRSKAPSAKSMPDIDQMFNDEVLRMENDSSSTQSQDLLSEAEESAKQAVDEFFAMGSQYDYSHQSSTVTEASLSANEKEQLYIQLEVCIVGLFEQMGRNKFALVTGRQAFISCAHYVVDEILAMSYPWFAAIPERPKHHRETEDESLPSNETQYTYLYHSLREVNVRLRRYVHQSISDLIDPTRSYTSILLLNTVLGLGTIKNLSDVAKKTKALQRSDNKVTSKGKYFRTSTAILAIFGDSKSYQTRKFLQRSGALYTSVPGAVTPFETKIERLKHLETIEEPIPPPLVATSSSRIGTAGTTSRPSTATSRVSTGGSTRRPGSQRSVKGSLPSGSTSPTREKTVKSRSLDFHKLFSDQPDAFYFPSGVYGDNVNLLGKDKIFLDPQDSDEARMNRINNIIQTSTGLNSQLRKVSRRAYLDQYAPSIHKGHFQATTIMLAPNNAVLTTTSRSKLSFDEDKRPLKDIQQVIHEEERRTTGDRIKFSQKSHKSLSFGTSTIQNIGPKVEKIANKLTLSNSGKLATTTTSQRGPSDEYSMNGSALSVSSSMDSLTLIQNKAADIPISLKAKTALMNLMVEKTSKTYIYDTQTDVTALRIALINGGNDTKLELKKHKSRIKNNSN